MLAIRVLRHENLTLPLVQSCDPSELRDRDGSFCSVHLDGKLDRVEVPGSVKTVRRGGGSLIGDIRGSCLPNNVEMGSVRRAQSSRVDAGAVREGRSAAKACRDKIVRRGVDKPSVQLCLRILGCQRAVFANRGAIVVAEHFGQPFVKYNAKRNVRGIYGWFGEITPICSSESHVDVLKRGLHSKVVLGSYELMGVVGINRRHEPCTELERNI